MQSRLQDRDSRSFVDSKAWWRRAVGFLLGFVLPWSLLTQLLGSLIVGRSWPEDSIGWVLSTLAFVTVSAVSAALSKFGQSPAQRLVGLRVLDAWDRPASRRRMFARNLAHLADFVSLGLGFLWPLWSPRGQTFADKLAGTTVRRDDLAGERS